MLDSRFTDADADETPAALLDPENLDPENDDDGAPETDGGAAAGATATATGQTIADFEQRAAGSTGCVRSCSSPRWQPTYRRTPTLCWAYPYRHTAPGTPGKTPSGTPYISS